MEFGDDPVVPNGPVGTGNVLVLCTLFLCRELEASTALRRNVRINNETKVVTWRLPTSKRDPFAFGAERSWGCTCSHDEGKGVATRSCPYHAAVKQLLLLEARFGPLVDDDELPFFPSASGFPTPPEAIVALIEFIAERCGEHLKTSDGVIRFGKHSWRSSGAVYLSSIGIEVSKIMLLARWDSPVVLHYCRLAPLKTITHDFKTATIKTQSHSHRRRTE